MSLIIRAVIVVTVIACIANTVLAIFDGRFAAFLK